MAATLSQALNQPAPALGTQSPAAGATPQQVAAAANQQQQQPVTKGVGGVLQQGQTLQDAVNQTGMQTAPTTPLGAQMIGASQDASKMAGTPAQLSAALNQQQTQAAPQNSLQTAVRDQQVRNQATGQEQATMQKSADMQALGGLGDRVTQYINNELTSLQQSSPVTQAANTTFTNTTGTTQDITSLAPDLAQLQKLVTTNPTDPATMQEMVKVQTALGMDTKTQLTPDQINSLYQSAEDAIAGGGAQNLAKPLTVSQLTQDPNFGYDANSLSNLLGIPAAQVSNMSVQQLSDAVNQVQANEFNKSQQLGQQATDTNTGLAQRNMARQAGQEASATGVRATEDDFNKLASAVQKGDTVTFNNQQYSVENLLQSDTISGIIKQYIEAPAGSAAQTTLQQTEPQLAKFISDNQAALTVAAQQMGQSATAFSGIQTYNNNLVSSIFGSTLTDPTILKGIVPDVGTLQAAQIDPNSVPVLAYGQQLGQQGAMQMATALQNANASDPTIAQQLPNLNLQQIQALAPGQQGGNFDKMVQANQLHNTVANLNVNDPNQVNSLYQQLYGVNTQQVQQAQQVNAQLGVLGLPGANLPTLDPTQLQQQVLQNVPTTTLAQAAQGNVPSVVQQQFPMPKPPSVSTPQGALFNQLSQSGILDKGYISASDVQNLYQNLPVDQLVALDQMAQNGAKIDPSIAEATHAAQVNYTTPKVQQAIQSGDPVSTFQNFDKLLSSGGLALDSGIVKQAMQQALNNEANSKSNNPNMNATVIPIAQKYGLDTSGFTQVNGNSGVWVTTKYGIPD